MCVVSMVHDHFQKQWPSPSPFHNPNTAIQTYTFPQFTSEEVADLRKMINDFKEAKAAAEIVDKLTGQPDCVDPEKARLEQRIVELEEQLDKIRDITTP